MSTKKINAGDTLTVGDLTDDHLGAVIEVGPVEGFTTRLELKAVSAYAPLRHLWSTVGACKSFRPHGPVTVITPPPVTQPDAPTILGQCIWIEGDDNWRGVVADPGSAEPIMSHLANWCSWEDVLADAGERQIIVSDPPRWPDETPVVPERIEVGEWPDDDTHLRDYRWEDRNGDEWLWEDGGWRVGTGIDPWNAPKHSPWTRGERVK